MISLNPNNVFKIEAISKDYFKSGDADLYIYQDNSAYGLENLLIGSVEIDLDSKRYVCVAAEFYDEEEFYDIVYKSFLKNVIDLSNKNNNIEFGAIKDDAGEILRKFIFKTGINHTLRSEMELLNEFENDLMNYHLCYKPEEQILK